MTADWLNMRFIESTGVPEEGDALRLSPRNLAISRGYHTDGEGIRQLKVLIAGMVVRFIEVPPPNAVGAQACLHLMSLISLIDRLLPVVYGPFLIAVKKQQV